MALGNNVSMGQGRGKNKATIVKRYKEVQTAKNYISFNASPMQAKSACSYPRSLSETFCHNGKGALPTTNDTVYRSKRANPKNIVKAGHYKVALGKTSKSLQINSAGVVIAVTNCP